MVITITRESLYPVPGFGYQQIRWNYSYSIDGATPVTYGPRLADLRGMLKRKYSNAKIVTAW